MEIAVRSRNQLHLPIFVLMALISVSCKQPVKSGTQPTHEVFDVNPGTNNILKKVPPQYPAFARAAHVQGTVILRAIIAENGTVESLDVLSGPDLLRGSAVDAVKQWVYKPYLLNGKPRRVETNVTVNFQFSPTPNLALTAPTTPPKAAHTD
jgi:protein TonB